MGAKLAYVREPWDIESGWLASTNGLPSGADFDTIPGTDKTFQWKLANASGDRPYEFGLYGSSGSFIVSNVSHVQYLHGYVEAGLGAHSGTENGGPAWRWFQWCTTPLGR